MNLALQRGGQQNCSRILAERKRAKPSNLCVGGEVCGRAEGLLNTAVTEDSMYRRRRSRSPKFSGREMTVRCAMAGSQANAIKGGRGRRKSLESSSPARCRG